MGDGWRITPLRIAPVGWASGGTRTRDVGGSARDLRAPSDLAVIANGFGIMNADPEARPITVWLENSMLSAGAATGASAVVVSTRQRAALSAAHPFGFLPVNTWEDMP